MLIIFRFNAPYIHKIEDIERHVERNPDRTIGNRRSPTGERVHNVTTRVQTPGNIANVISLEI